MKAPLYRIAHVRSGDKGNTAIVGVFAYAHDLFPPLAVQLTTDLVARVFGAAVTGKVTRYEVPSIDALNFTLEGALGGGVSRNLSLDNFGKALCARLLSIEIEVPDSLANQLRDRQGRATMDGVQIAHTYYDAVTANDTERMASLFHKDAVLWQSYERIERPIAEILAAIKSFNETVKASRFEDRRYIAVADGAVCQHVHRVTALDGRLSENCAMQHIYVEDGLIRRIEVYCGPSLVLKS